MSYPMRNFGPVHHEATKAAVLRSLALTGGHDWNASAADWGSVFETDEIYG